MFGKVKALLFDNLTSLFLQNKLQNTPSTNSVIYTVRTPIIAEVRVSTVSQFKIGPSLHGPRTTYYLAQGRSLCQITWHMSQLIQPMWSNLEPLFCPWITINWWWRDRDHMSGISCICHICMLATCCKTIVVQTYGTHILLDKN